MLFAKQSWWNTHNIFNIGSASSLEPNFKQPSSIWPFSYVLGLHISWFPSSIQNISYWGRAPLKTKMESRKENCLTLPFASGRGQKFILQACDAMGFWCKRHPVADLPFARHWTDLTCMPPPQVTVHCRVKQS